MRSIRVRMLLLSMALGSAGAFASDHRTVFEGHCRVNERVFLSVQFDKNNSESLGFAIGGLSNFVYVATAEFFKRDDGSFVASFRIRETDSLTGKAEKIGSFSSINIENSSKIVGNQLFLERETASPVVIKCLGQVINRPLN